MPLLEADAYVLTRQDLTRIEEVLGKPGDMNLVSIDDLQEFGIETIMTYCVTHGVYQIPTRELIDWLTERIAGRKALEICAGHGDIGRMLGIQSTDSHLHLRPEVAESYRAMRQAITIPPARVEKLEALAAVRKYRPAVVIGAWASELDKKIGNPGSLYGVDERALWSMACVRSYLSIGATQVHGKKKLLRRTHEIWQQPWLISRSMKPANNVVYVWDKS